MSARLQRIGTMKLLQKHSNPVAELLLTLIILQPNSAIVSRLKTALMA
ncbi:MAG: hypothetical protein SAK29_06950 [Scytonema sp. PMC 1069.18]|nr:hypothetical protein [Scytonema sp. PMC 1069.18]MEC4880714.1 hypothetical protein [Scytonema sp. PMC 1070.18]